MGDNHQHVLWENVWAWFTNTRLIRLILLFALGWVLVQVLEFFRPVIVIFTFAAILAFLLGYPVHWLQHFIPRGIAVLGVFVVTLLLLSGFAFTIGVTVLAQGQQLLTQAPEWIDASIALLTQLQDMLTSVNLEVDFTQLGEQFRTQALSGVGVGLGLLQAFFLRLVDLILISVIAFFMLLDGDRLWTYLIQSVPSDYRDRVSDSIRQNLLGFFWGRFLLSVFFSASCLVAFWFLKAPYALLLSAIAGLLDLIPGIGATLGVSLIALILLPNGIWLSVTVIVVCILLQQVQENILLPHIMQGSINMNPVVMFFALLVGFQIAGLLGLFLATPIAGVLISLFNIDAMKGNQRS
ncbi:MAG: AI-2E family transporter [Synechococcales cyanobacterium T60_A2020_003]|nr:AI-2E family transporter [Synechococcales cyanobacterium T60_A2020_003]